MKHKAQFGWIGRTQKTVKAECGKRVPCSQVAIESDTDCPACRKAVDDSCLDLIALAEHAAQHGVEQKVVDDARRCATDPKRYQTVYFL